MYRSMHVALPMLRTEGEEERPQETEAHKQQHAQPHVRDPHYTWAGVSKQERCERHISSVFAFQRAPSSCARARFRFLCCLCVCRSAVSQPVTPHALSRCLARAAMVLVHQDGENGLKDGGGGSPIALGRAAAALVVWKVPSEEAEGCSLLPFASTLSG